MLAQGGIRLTPRGSFLPLTDIRVGGLILAALNLLMIVAVLFFFLSILLGGIRMILSGGNKDQMDSARRQLVNALIGIVLVFSVWAISSLVEAVFGVSLLNFDIPVVQDF
jgi:hypothetical protein